MMLAGRVVLVTGANRGIGHATARLCAQHGARVILAGRRPDALAQAIAAIQEELPDAALTAQVLDVTQPASVRDAFQAVFRAERRLDVLVANAGILEDALIGMVSADQVQRTFEANTFGFIHCAQYASRLMARHAGGSIVALSSIIGVEGNAGQTVYAASKAAVIGAVRSLAKELAPQNIRVNAIAPGFIDTDMARSIGAERFRQRVAAVGMGRIGLPEEVARTALFLASDLSSYVTGQVIGVDGGMLI